MRTTAEVILYLLRRCTSYAATECTYFACAGVRSTLAAFTDRFMGQRSCGGDASTGARVARNP
jgi:hypothetical protein